VLVDHAGPHSPGRPGHLRVQRGRTAQPGGQDRQEAHAAGLNATAAGILVGGIRDGP